jgi:hypothetical protein
LGNIQARERLGYSVKLEHHAGITNTLSDLGSLY